MVGGNIVNNTCPMIKALGILEMSKLGGELKCESEWYKCFLIDRHSRDLFRRIPHQIEHCYLIEKHGSISATWYVGQQAEFCLYVLKSLHTFVKSFDGV